MDIVYALVPLSILLIAIAILIFNWAVKSGQFDDLESPSHKILYDDDELYKLKQGEPETKLNKEQEND